MDDNAQLWSAATGKWNLQGAGGAVLYVPNYDAILAWLKLGPQTLPGDLCAGRVRYYSAIPTTIPMNWQTGLIANGASADQVFWKDYIDFVLGAGRHNRSKTLYGQDNDNNWSGTTYANNATIQITPKASLTAPTPPYMRYDDIPVHPRLHTWFGPLTMLGFISLNSDITAYNWNAGTTYEAQCWQLKAGISAALGDIQTNHPNDLASLVYFSSQNAFNVARVPMGTSYSKMKNCLFYPYTLLNNLGDPTQEVRPYLTTGPMPATRAG